MVLWRAYLTNKYYANESNFDEIPDLLLTWPYEEFVLRELIPCLPSKLEDFVYVRDKALQALNPYGRNRNKLEFFYTNVVYTIMNALTNRSNVSASVQNGHYCKMMHIDISGIYIGIGCMMYMDQITEMIEIKEPFLKNSIGKLEILLDVYIDVDNTDILTIEAYTKRLNGNTYYNSFDSISLKFNHITLSDNFETCDMFTGFIEGLMANGPKSIALDGKFDGSDILQRVTKLNKPLDHILAIMFHHCDSSLSFLQHFKNLIHLDLGACNLHDKLDALGHMERGLVYLNMCGCELTTSDLRHLLGSSHQATLQELNIGLNNFDEAD